MQVVTPKLDLSPLANSPYKLDRKEVNSLGEEVSVYRFEGDSSMIDRAIATISTLIRINKREIIPHFPSGNRAFIEQEVRTHDTVVISKTHLFFTLSSDKIPLLRHCSIPTTTQVNYYEIVERLRSCQSLHYIGATHNDHQLRGIERLHHFKITSSTSENLRTLICNIRNLIESTPLLFFIPADLENHQIYMKHHYFFHLNHLTLSEFGLIYTTHENDCERNPHLDLSMIQGRGNPWIMHEIKRIEDREIRIFQLKDAYELDSPEVAKSIWNLRIANPSLCLAIETSNNNSMILKGRFLIINGFAVSSANMAPLPDTADSDFVDKYFSGGYLEAPIRCKEGHVLDRVRAELWAAQRNGECPAGEHPLDGFTVLKRLAVRINDYKSDPSIQRALYRLDERMLQSELKAYLLHPSDRQLAVLKRFGLSPSQIDQQCPPTDIPLFTGLFDTTSDGSNQSGTDLINQFKTYFPTIHKQVVSDLARPLIAAELAENPTTYKEILNRFDLRVLGQKEAKEAVAAELACQQEMRSDDQNNIVFLFVGPSGVGKTELAKAAGQEKENRFVAYAMNEFSLEHSITNLLGVSAGYMGSGGYPRLAQDFKALNAKRTKKIGQKTEFELENAVILFDEFEKAHINIQSSLMTLFDEGKITLSYVENGYSSRSETQTISFTLKKCMIVATSNLHQDALLSAFQRGLPYKKIVNDFIELNNASKGNNLTFKKEILARMNVVPFGPIPRGEIFQSLLRIKLESTLQDLKKDFHIKEWTVDDENTLYPFLEEKLYGNGTDVRTRVLQYFRQIKTDLIKAKAKTGSFQTKRITAGVVNGEFAISVSIFLENLGIYAPIPGVDPIVIQSY